ncbi:biotin--[acetyl-CoA-carboxylase] ligase [Pseudoroseicyclus aestuarii]|uniref:biotin--[biotin carboxyl-carrier protein] ligase n=1 Tax=Pseudoroseicyclus aestuarii TaxID=1795041 RepID=A0A318SV31_9RHOB|nr:biotin--[acetyl-CoA-carboxylase] ligase [Pseudoroseicyclus aestuarii]PYE84156.1 BirA family biotin operon repressor/biotin-[acetyl-CoA-carboxylase] ligase [Pseudoroseicyclus aestuarii]
MSPEGPDLGPRGGLWPEGFGLVQLDEAVSTMDEARRLLPDLERPTWVMAHRQSGGRGRRGRSWQMPEGNLAATLIYRPEATPHEAAKRSFLAGLALFEALAIHVDRTRLSLKWPNDVLLDDRKVAGILLESAGAGAYVDWLSIGIGVNVAGVPEGLEAEAFPPISLAEAGAEVTAEEVLTLIAEMFATEEGKLGAFGFPYLREEWLRHAARIGEVITARLPDEEVTGRFDTVDMDGNLMLETAEGPRLIAAADVFWG